MKWLTIKEIQEAAKAGPLEAVECSIAHWKQIQDSSPEELWDAFNRGRVSSIGNHCALCQRYVPHVESSLRCPTSTDCTDCPLNILQGIRCGSETMWADAQQAYYARALGHYYNASAFDRMIDMLNQCRSIVKENK